MRGFLRDIIDEHASRLEMQALRLLRRTGFAVASVLVAAIVGAASLLAVLAAVTIQLAGVVGTALALLIVGGSSAAFAAIGALIIARRWLPREQPQPADDVPASPPAPAAAGADPPASPSRERWWEDPIASLTSDPVALGGALFAAVTVLGPFRAARVASRAAAAAGMVKSVAQSLQPLSDAAASRTEPRTESRTPEPVNGAARTTPTPSRDRQPTSTAKPCATDRVDRWVAADGTARVSSP